MYPTPHSAWISWLDGRPARIGSKRGEPINRRRIAERIDRSPDVISRWATGDRRDLQARDWTLLLRFVMEEVGGTDWPTDFQMAVYWGGPDLYESSRRRRLFPMPARTRKRAA